MFWVKDVSLPNAADEGNLVCYRTDRLVLATGFLSSPRLPSVPGLGKFKGLSLHTQH